MPRRLGVAVYAGLSLVVPALSQEPPLRAPVSLPPVQPLPPPTRPGQPPPPPKVTGGPMQQPGLLPRPVAPPAAVPPTTPPQPPVAPQPAATGHAALPPQDDRVRLPRDERLTKIDPRTMSVKRLDGTWQVWANGKPFRDFGDDAATAHHAADAVRKLHPSEWAVIGTDRPVLEYGLTYDPQADARVPPVGIGKPQGVVPIDFRTARVDAVRGAWCLRDDGGLLLNFGRHREDAEQALAVARRYGFNRVGFVGRAAAPAMSYLFAEPEQAVPGAPPANQAGFVRTMQEQAMTRTGIEVPGVGYVGEKVKFDPRKVEVRRENRDYVVAAGADVLGRFGASEWAARDAARVIQDARFTEHCTFGTAGVAFFLANGQAPKNVPFFAQAGRFDPATLRVRELAGKWWVCDGSKQLLPAGSAEEGETLAKIVRAYGFDTLCQVGSSPRAQLKFLGRSR